MDVTRGTKALDTLIAGLEATPGKLAALVSRLDDATLDAAPEGEWPIRVIVAHLRDDEFMVMRLRFERMVVEDHPTLTPFDEKVWAASGWLGHEHMDDMLADFKIQRDASLRIIRRVSGDDWQRTGLQPEYGAFDVHWWLEHWLGHDETHLAQIEALLP